MDIIKKQNKLIEIAEDYGFERDDLRGVKDWNIKLVRIIPFLMKHNNIKELRENFVWNRNFWELMNLTGKSTKTLNDFIIFLQENE